MEILLFVTAGIILIALIFFYTLRQTIKCPHCLSKDVAVTGAKKYKEDNFSIQGSPSSYNEIEYKCNKCGGIFRRQKNAVIFN